MTTFGFARWIWMLCGSLFVLLILAAIVALVIWAARSWSRSGRGAGTYTTPERTSGDRAIPDRALDVLRERYARGEITKEQYDQMRRDLTG